MSASLALLVVAAPAWARHRHHHGHRLPALSEMAPDLPDRPWTARDRRARLDSAAFVPTDWNLQPPDPKWTGKRFVSPDGRAWFAAYSSEVAQEPVAAHMRSVAFADGETLTSIRGESDWIVVTGTKGDRMFYRKAIIACGGRTWHHIAFEYPLDLSRHIAPMVKRASLAVDASENDGCNDPVAAAPAAQKPAAATTGAAAAP